MNVARDSPTALDSIAGMVGVVRGHGKYPTSTVGSFFVGLLLVLTPLTSIAQYSPEAHTVIRTDYDAPASTRVGRKPEIISPSILQARPTAAPPAPVYKTSGTDFFIAFPSAVGSDIPSDPPYKTLYISARSHVRGKISLLGGTWSQSFVADPAAVTPVTLPAWAGFERYQTEQIYQKVFEITADDEIAVYALSHHHLSTDGFLVLPAEALGTRYSIASVKNALLYNGGRVSSKNPFMIDTVPRSEFVIAGTQNNTTVTVQLSANSFARTFLQGKSYSFTINKGDAMEITARDTGATGKVGIDLCWVGKLPGVDCDLTGSIITADKPIAIFSGHERASVPDSFEYNYVGHPSVSRDHIVEQMPPAEKWGRMFAYIPSSLGQRSVRPLSGDVVRVITGDSPTDVFINNVYSTTVAQGSYKQFTLNKAALISTSEPSLVVKYLQTAHVNPITNVSDTVGDPDMTVLPPIENMSTYYTIPTLSAGGAFTEHYIAIVCDSDARTTTTLNGYPLDQKILYPLAGTKYYYTVLHTFEGTQRVESPFPCYAETYGYGYYDSYSFSGGGSFAFINALKAQDLDFGTIPLGGSPDSNSVITANLMGLLNDPSQVFHYSWESGDTAVFSVLDTIRSPIPVLPGKSLPVRFRFTPPKVGPYSAVLRVWSNNKTPVFIRVLGTATTPTLSVGSLDFGRVRRNLSKDGYFFLKAYNANLNLATTDLNSLQVLPTPFDIDPLHTLLQLLKSTDAPENVLVTFKPPARQFYRQSIPIAVLESGVSPQQVVITGRGVDYDVPVVDTTFGKVRIDSLYTFTSPWYDIPVHNYGDDSASIVSLSLISGDIQDFQIDQAQPLPTSVAPWVLDTVKSGFEAHSYRARFAPRLDSKNNVIDTGRRVAVVKIGIADDRVSGGIAYVFDTLRGIGAEPIIKVTTPVIDFGTFVDPIAKDSVVLDTLLNIGTFSGSIIDLHHSDTNFELLSSSLSTLPFPSVLSETQRLPFAARFKIGVNGDFYDTVYAYNDSRFEPVVYLQAKVRAGLAPTSPIFLDTVSSCDPVDTVINLHNPSSATIYIDTIAKAGDSAGYVIGENLGYPISIPGGGDFSLKLRYIFPEDSLNGVQKTYFILYRRITEGLQTLHAFDTITLTVVRHAVQLNLQTTLPPFKPSAGDDPFKVPVYLHGNRFGIDELNNDTIVISFSNELIRPVKIDRTGSLTEASSQVPNQPDFIWDPVTKILKVPMLSTNLSANTSKNDLLFTILCNTFLTADTTVSISTGVGYVHKPCAFRIAMGDQTIIYANECGNQTIRDLLLTKKLISISDPHPNPSGAGNQAVVIGYIVSKDMLLSWQLFDERGMQVLSEPPAAIGSGQGDITIPMAALPASGIYYLQITADSKDGTGQKQLSTRFSVVK